MDKRTKWLMAGVAFIATLFILERLVYTPWKDKWSKLGGEITKTKAAIAATREVVARESSVQADWKKVKAQLDRPEREGIDRGFVFVVGALAAHADSNPGLDPRTPEQSGDFKEIVVTTQLKCTIEGLTKFLIAVYNSPELLRIRRLEVTSQYEKSDDKMMVNAKISTIMYSPKPNTKP